MKYARFMIHEDVKLVTIKPTSFTVAQGILNPTPWFFHTEKRRKHMLCYMISIIKTTTKKKNPKNNVKVNYESNHQYQSKNSKADMLIKLKIPVLVI
jgi:hypothetical protein